MDQVMRMADLSRTTDFEQSVLLPIFGLRTRSQINKELLRVASELGNRIVWGRSRDRALLTRQQNALLRHTPAALMPAVCKRLGIERKKSEAIQQDKSRTQPTPLVSTASSKKRKNPTLQQFLSRKPHKKKSPARKSKKPQVSYEITYHVADEDESHPVLNPAFLSLLAGAPIKSTNLIDKPVAVLGDGPWPEKTLTRFLKDKRIYGISLKQNVEAVVIGSSNVDTGRIREWLEDTGDSARIYPQELFLLYAMTGFDPLKAIDRDYALHWIENHPVLKELFGDSDDELRWIFDTGARAKDEWFDEDQEVIHLPHGDSPLAKMGYKVGMHFGAPTAERRQTLKEAFEGKIPKATHHSNIDAYMEQWGAPRTSQRLWRIARHLAGQIYLKRRNPTMEVAVYEWGEDLKWLHKNIYPRVRYRFRWPRDFD
jgi:hypothetical protein